MATTPSMLDADPGDWAQPYEQLQQAQQTAAAAGPVDQATPPDPAQQQLAQAQQAAAQGAPVDTTSAPQSGQMLDYQQAQHHSRLDAIKDAIGDALGGKSYNVTRGSDGKLVVEERAATPGEKWSRAGLAALKGAAAGFSVQNGPGNLGRAFAAGAGSGMQMGADRRTQQVQQADADFDAQQKAQTQAANMALLNQRIHAGAFQAKRDGVEFGELQADRGNGIAKMIQDANGVDLGTSEHVDDLADLAKRNPELVHQHAQGRIYSEPEFDGDGKVTGVHNYLIDQDWAGRRNAKEVSFQDLAPGANPATDDPVAKVRTIPAGAMTNGEIMLAQQAANERLIKAAADRHKSQRDDLNTTSEVGLRGAQGAEARGGAAKNYAEARKADAEAGQLGTGGAEVGSGTLGPDGLDPVIKQGMKDGGVDVTKLFGTRNGSQLRARYVAAVLRDDPTWTQQKYDTMLGMNKDLATGKMGDQVQSLNTFIGHAGQLSGAVSTLRNTSVPLANKPVNWLRQNASSNPAVAAIIPEIEATKNEFQNFLANHALTKDEITRGEHMLSEDQSPAQMQGAIKSFMSVALTKGGTVNERYQRTMSKPIANMLNPNARKHVADMGLGNFAETVIPGSMGGGAPQPPPPQRQGAAAPAAPPPPKVGDIVQGHRFNGGNPADPKSWSAQ